MFVGQFLLWGLLVVPLGLDRLPAASLMCDHVEAVSFRADRLFVEAGAVETSLLCGQCTKCRLASRFRIGRQVFGLGWVCRFCLSAPRPKWSRVVWAPHESRSLAFPSVLMLTLSRRNALWLAPTLRRMASRVGGWWGPLLFIRPLAAFSLSITDCLTFSPFAVGKKRLNSPQKSAAVHVNMFSLNFAASTSNFYSCLCFLYFARLLSLPSVWGLFEVDGTWVWRTVFWVGEVTSRFPTEVWRDFRHKSADLSEIKPSWATPSPAPSCSGSA